METIFRSTFLKAKIKAIYYCYYKKFNLEQFQVESQEKVDEIWNNSFHILLKEFRTYFDEFTPFKRIKLHLIDLIAIF